MSRPRLPEEYEQLRSTVEQFAHDVVAPVIAAHYEARTFPYEIVAGMADLGLLLPVSGSALIPENVLS